MLLLFTRAQFTRPPAAKPLFLPAAFPRKRELNPSNFGAHITGLGTAVSRPCLPPLTRLLLLNGGHMPRGVRRRMHRTPGARPSDSETGRVAGPPYWHQRSIFTRMWVGGFLTRKPDLSKVFLVDVGTGDLSTVSTVASNTQFYYGSDLNPFSYQGDRIIFKVGREPEGYVLKNAVSEWRRQPPSKAVKTSPFSSQPPGRHALLLELLSD